MSADIIIPPGLDGDIVQITVKTEDGELDDLTQYLTVFLTVKSADFTSTPVNNLDMTSLGAVTADGEVNWDPDGALITPGKYWIIINRTASNVNRPAYKVSLEVTQHS